MNNLEKITEMLNNDPELVKKLAAETKRLAESGKKNMREITAEAIKAVFGMDLTDEELKQIVNVASKAAEEPKKLDLDALDDVAGGDFSVSELGSEVAKGAAGGAVGGGGAGFIIGSGVPLIGNVVGTIAGAVAGAAVNGAIYGISYVINS